MSGRTAGLLKALVLLICVATASVGAVDRAQGSPLHMARTEEPRLEEENAARDGADLDVGGVVKLPEDRLLAAAVAQEQSVLRRALEDMAGWISQLPVGSPWRRAFVTARAEIASVAEPLPVSAARTERLEGQS